MLKVLPLLFFIFWSSLILGKSITFNWQPVSGAEYYQIQVSRDLSFAKVILDVTSERTSISLNLKSGLFFYRVRAIDKVRLEGYWSRTDRIYVGPNSPQFVHPNRAEVHYTAGSPKIRFEWKIEASSYDPPSSFILVINGRRISTSKNWYEIARPSQGVYNAKVKAISRSGKESEFSAPVKVHVDGKGLRLLKPSHKDVMRNVNVQFQWVPIQQVSGYNLYIYKDSSLKKLFKKQFVRGYKHTFAFVPSGKYFWFVVAVKGSKESKLRSQVRMFETLFSVYF